MPREKLHTSDIKIEQKGPIVDQLLADRAPEIVRADPSVMKEVAANLAFMDEPMEIRLEPSAEKNAPPSYPVWVNGVGAECLMADGKWRSITYLPVGVQLITKRKYVAVLVTAKYDAVTTEHDEPGAHEYVQNRINRQTSASVAFSVIEDKNPKGGAWLTELRRRNF